MICTSYKQNKKGEVMTTLELFEQMQTLWNDFADNHAKFVDKGNKTAATRARKTIGELKKLVTDYRKESVNECKK
jgi:hypothetical protein